MAGGIYRIQNTKDGKSYVGSALSFSRRWSNHRRHLRQNIHVNPRLQNAWNKYGEDAFIFEVIETDLEATQLVPREQFWLDQSEPCVLYNIDLVAGSRLGHRHTQATREKLRTANLGKRATDETRCRMSARQRGRVVTPAARRKISESNRTRTITAATRKKMSESAKKKPPVTAEARQRMSDARRGRPRTPETIQKMRRNCGHPHTPEMRQELARIKQGKSKLTWVDVREMRTTYQQTPVKRGVIKELSRIFGVSRRYVSFIIHNEQWVDANYSFEKASKGNTNV